ncbi:MAG: B12-binding domain-containing radical SAM protein [Proteobacteria bacterium]|nr:B12-binding domain-containing radical SAM protein [Pseudomonadota bacterium]
MTEGWKKAFAPIRRVLFFLPGPYVYEDRCQTYIGRGSLFSFREPPEETQGAAILGERGVQCAILHRAARRASPSSALRDIAAFAPDLVILSSTFPGHPQDLSWAEAIKKKAPGTRVLARGGHHAFIDRENLLERFPALDGLIRGETEWVLENLDLENPLGSPGTTWRTREGLIEGEDPSFWEDLDTLPPPARGFLFARDYPSPDTGRPMATVNASRGCLHSCSFCLAPLVCGSNFRLRSPKSVTAEILRCRRELGVNSFFLRAENLATPRGWLHRLCENLAQEAPGIRFVCSARADDLDEESVMALAEAGCWGIGMGMESGSSSTQEKIRKNLSGDNAKRAIRLCRKHNILTLAYYMIGFPWETREDIEETIRFARDLQSPVQEFFFPYPYPGTPLYDLALESMVLGESAPPPRAQQVPVFLPKGMTRNELVLIRAQARLDPRALFRGASAVLRRTETPGEALRVFLRLARGVKTLA